MSVALYALLCVIWGSTWLAIKVGYGGLGPFNVAAIRFLIAGAVLSLMIRPLGTRWPRGRTEWAVVTFVGFVLFAADYGLIYWGEQFLDSGLTAIIFATLPLITAIFAHFYVSGDRLTSRKLGGTLIAFLGVVALFAEHLRVDLSASWPMLAIVASAACAAAVNVVTKEHGSGLHPATLNAPAMLIGGVVLVVVSLTVGDGFRLPSETASWGAILYLAIAGSVIAFLGYFSLLKKWNVTSMSFIAIFTPTIALMLGFVFLNERPTFWTGLGALLILAGVTLALARERLQHA